MSCGAGGGLNGLGQGLCFTVWPRVWPMRIEHQVFMHDHTANCYPVSFRPATPDRPSEVNYVIDVCQLSYHMVTDLLT